MSNRPKCFRLRRGGLQPAAPAAGCIGGLDQPHKLQKTPHPYWVPLTMAGATNACASCAPRPRASAGHAAPAAHPPIASRTDRLGAGDGPVARVRVCVSKELSQTCVLHMLRESNTHAFATYATHSGHTQLSTSMPDGRASTGAGGMRTSTKTPRTLSRAAEGARKRARDGPCRAAAAAAAPRGRQSRAPPRPSTVLGARRPLAAARSAGARRCRQRRSRRCRWRRESCRGRRAASHVSGRVARARCVRGGRATVKEMERGGEERRREEDARKVYGAATLLVSGQRARAARACLGAAAAGGASRARRLGWARGVK